MSTNKTTRELVNGLIACDDQPRIEQLTELRQSLELKVTDMKKKGQFAQYLFIAGFFIMAFGFALFFFANREPQVVTWLSRTGFFVLVVGAIVLVVAVFGRAHFQGLGNVWTRHDLHDVAIMELSLQVQQLSQRLDQLESRNPGSM